MVYSDLRHSVNPSFVGSVATKHLISTATFHGKNVYSWAVQIRLRASSIISARDEQKLTGKEAEHLGLLALNLNRVLEREVALKGISGDDNYVNSRSMDVFISKLRKYLKDDPKVEIMSVHGKGFKLVVG
jgi:DNA-binding response OmpR family regulator